VKEGAEEREGERNESNGAAIRGQGGKMAVPALLASWTVCDHGVRWMQAVLGCWRTL